MVGNAIATHVITPKFTSQTMLKDIIGGIANLFTKEEPSVGNQIGVDDSSAIDLVEQWGNNYHGSASKDKKNRAYEVIKCRKIDKFIN